MRVLIAEDDWLLADTLAVLLEEQGADVIGPAPEARKALALVQSTELDFALVDMNLRDGFSDELLQRLAERHVPFAIVTAYHALPTNSADLAVTTLHKPIDHRKLFDILSLYANGSAAV